MKRIVFLFAAVLCCGLLGFAVACSDDGGKGGSDAGTDTDTDTDADECLPPEVPDPWDITFHLWEYGDGTDFEGALVEVFDSSDELLASGTTDAEGEVTLSVATGGVPIDGYYVTSSDEYMPFRTRFQGGLGKFDHLWNFMVSEAEADALVMEDWDVERDPDAAICYFGIFECNTSTSETGLEGAVVTFSPEGTPVGINTLEGFNAALPSTTPWGLGAAANIPAGDNTITVDLDGEQDVYEYELRSGYWEALVLYPQPAWVPDGDYWEDGSCFGNDHPSSPDCNGVTYEGCCDDGAKVLWCQNDDLYCIDCPVEHEIDCGWNEAEAFYDCSDQPGGEDPSEEHPIDCP